MASLFRSIELAAPAAVVWDARLDGDVRTVTFANGLVVAERILGVDDARMRVAYAAQGGSASYHHASMQVVPVDASRCRLEWSTEALPDAVAGGIGALMDLGAAAMRRTFAAG